MNARDRLALSRPLIAIGQKVSDLQRVVLQRAPRPGLAAVAVPLAMTATMMELLWWTWAPLIVCAWWWADRSWKWTWIVSVEAAAIGAQWSYLGVYALADWPSARLLVSACWIAYPLLIALASYVARRRTGETPYQGY